MEVRQMGNDIDGKKAAVIASQYFIELMGGTPNRLAVEELEKKLEEGDHPFWYVTLGYASGEPTLQLPPPRYFKSFRIDGITGEVLSMKIRSV